VILVDTSVWIDYFRGIDNVPAAKLDQALTIPQEICITSAILQEILQGSDSAASLARFERQLRVRMFYHPLHPIDSYVAAARLYSRCRRVGVTIRSTIDCLIAQVAIEHGLDLLHNDRDFEQMARVVPELRIY
jgi:predicted nucleic acid-binding protein